MQKKIAGLCVLLSTSLAFAQESLPSPSSTDTVLRAGVGTDTHERRGLETSRGAMSSPARRMGLAPREQWTEIRLSDDRRGWVKTGELVFSVPTRLPGVGVSSSLPFGQKLTARQKEAVHGMVVELQAKGFSVRAEDIVIFMALETAGTFSPSIRAQGKADGAVGLAQFTDIAITDLNRRRAPGSALTKEILAAMSFEEQCPIVVDHLSTAFERKGMKGKPISIADLYSAIFAPAAIGLPLTATVYCSSRDGRKYHANRSLDQNKDGKITKDELVIRLDDWTRRGETLRD